MRYLQHALMVAILVPLVFIGYRASSAHADEDSAASDTLKVFPRSYPIADLPVWSKDGKSFDPIVLIAYLKVSVSPENWTADSTMAPSASTKSLVVSTTSTNHDFIHTKLEELRVSLRSEANGSDSKEDAKSGISGLLFGNSKLTFDPEVKTGG